MANNSPRKRAVRTIKAKYGKDFYKKIGKLGGNPHLKRGGYRYR